MASAGATDPEERLDQRAAWRARGRIAAVAAGVAAAVAGVAGIWVGARLTVAGVRWGRRTARFGFRVATFRLYRPCADCRKRIHADARVCRHCGYRKPARRRRRSL